MIIRVHLLPAFGDLPLDAITERKIEAYKASKVDGDYAKKTIYNHLTVLRCALILAHRFKLLDAVPEILWLKVPKPEFDFLSFDEADRLLTAVAPYSE